MTAPWEHRHPEGWRIAPLSTVVRETRARNKGLIEKNLLSLSYGSIVRRDIGSADGLVPASYETYQIVEPGQVVLRMTDLQNDMRSLRSGAVAERGIITSAYIAIEPVGVMPAYLAWLLRGYDHMKVFYSFGGGVRQSLTFADLKRLPTMLPPEGTQRRIADYLDRETATIDALIEKQRRLLVVLLERRREAIRAAVFGSNEACLNADPLEALPEGWRRAKLRHVATMHTGHTPSRSKPEYWEDTSIPWFTLADVWQLRPGTRKYLGETKSMISPLGLENSAAELLPKGTVVLSRTASVGFTGIMPRAMATSQDYWNWVCGPQLCPEFLWNVFRAMKSDFDSLKAGSTHKTIYQADAAALQIPLPPVQTQQAIVDHLDRETTKIDALIAKAERFIELAQERRAALITAAVTGQIDTSSE